MLDEHRFDVQPWLKDGASVEPVYTSALGALFAADCMEVLPHIKSGVVDMVFADPPFNLGKEYGENCNDLRPDKKLLKHRSRRFQVTAASELTSPEIKLQIRGVPAALTSNR